MAGVI